MLSCEGTEKVEQPLNYNKRVANISFLLFFAYLAIEIKAFYMLLANEQPAISSFSVLYNIIVPKDNLLRKINELIDFSFIYDELYINTA